MRNYCFNISVLSVFGWLICFFFFNNSLTFCRILFLVAFLVLSFSFKFLGSFAFSSCR